MHTLVLNHHDVLRHLDGLLLLEDLRNAFKTDAKSRPTEPLITRAIPRNGAATSVLMPGCLDGVPAYTVQVQTAGMGKLQSMLLLHDADTGRLLALMDAQHLASLRSAVVGALGADVLARPDASKVALIGASGPASMHLKTLRLVRSLNQLRVWDSTPGRAFELAYKLQSTLQLPSREAESVEEAVSDADIVVVLSGGDEPLLRPEMLPKGCHVTALGLEMPGRRGVSLSLFQKSEVFCDHKGLALTMGAAGSVGLPDAEIRGELGEVLAGRIPGRRNPDEITVFSHMGLPFQDLVAAWMVYLGAKSDDAITRIDFSA
ncbi:MAG: ornithine cyclodeaminase family protein [Myxococcaceae bacterium]